MFPLFNSQRTPDNLTEIPIPKQTLSGGFVSIAESEPFGPVDAAEILEIEPAQKFLEKFSGPSDAAAQALKAKKQELEDSKIFVAKKAPHERNGFVFKKVKAGEVGFRYGTVLRDNKRNRKITYDETGRMVYGLTRV